MDPMSGYDIRLVFTLQPRDSTVHCSTLHCSTVHCSTKNLYTSENIMKYQLDTKCVEKLSMIIGCNIWMICLEFN